MIFIDILCSCLIVFPIICFLCHVDILLIVLFYLKLGDPNLAMTLGFGSFSLLISLALSRFMWRTGVYELVDREGMRECYWFVHHCISVLIPRIPSYVGYYYNPPKKTETDEAFAVFFGLTLAVCCSLVHSVLLMYCDYRSSLEIDVILTRPREALNPLYLVTFWLAEAESAALPSKNKLKNQTLFEPHLLVLINDYYWESSALAKDHEFAIQLQLEEESQEALEAKVDIPYHFQEEETNHWKPAPIYQNFQNFHKQTFYPGHKFDPIRIQPIGANVHATRKYQ